MASVSKNVYNNKLDDVVNENNNKYITEPLKWSLLMYSQERLLTLCEVSDRVRILKYKIFL